MVRTAHLSTDEILHAIKDGDFYASTGVELKGYQADTKTVSVTIRAHGSNKYRVQFIGRNGRILQDAVANSATCAIKLVCRLPQ